MTAGADRALDRDDAHLDVAPGSEGHSKSSSGACMAAARRSAICAGLSVRAMGEHSACMAVEDVAPGDSTLRQPVYRHQIGRRLRLHDEPELLRPPARY